MVEQDVVMVLKAAAERGLPSLLIGGNAVIALGYLRATNDLDLLVRETQRTQWLDLLGSLKFRFFHGQGGFAQFEVGPGGAVPLDLMFVDDQTWQHLMEGAREVMMGGETAMLPKPEFLVALKLHSATSATRSKPEVDWEDIRQIVRICGLDPAEESFRKIILRYGGEDGLRRIEGFPKD